jgi:hypothetical protein
MFFEKSGPALKELPADGVAVNGDQRLPITVFRKFTFKN